MSIIIYSLNVRTKSFKLILTSGQYNKISKDISDHDHTYKDSSLSKEIKNNIQVLWYVALLYPTSG